MQHQNLRICETCVNREAQSPTEHTACYWDCSGCHPDIWGQDPVFIEIRSLLLSKSTSFAAGNLLTNNFSSLRRRACCWKANSANVSFSFPRYVLAIRFFGRRGNPSTVDNIERRGSSSIDHHTTWLLLQNVHSVADTLEIKCRTPNPLSPANDESCLITSDALG